MSDLTFTLAPDALERLVELIAERVAEIVGRRDSADVQRWPGFMCAETAAQYLDVSVERVRKLKERREIPFIQEAPGHRVLFARRDLDSWMTSLRHEPHQGGA